MVSNSDYGYYIWQKKRHSKCKNGSRQKLDIPNGALINPNAIVLTIISTITLIKDQERELKQRSVSALALTAATVKANSNI